MIIEKITKISDKISDLIIKNRKSISITIYILSVASLLFLVNPNTIKDTGEYSIQLLWFLLILPILSKVFSIKIAGKLMIFRKEVGILMGVMAFVHTIQYFIEPYSYMFWEIDFWFLNGNITYLAWGFIALIIAIILTITSNKFSIKKLGKYWKVLHRIVYILVIFSLLHVAYIKISKDDFLLELIVTFIPFIIYFSFKVLEWKGVKINLLEIIKKINNEKV